MNKYNIQIVSNLTGLSVHTLRAWEKRYSAITPQRSDNGRRIYSEPEIEKLQMLQKLCSIGHSISHIANKESEELQQMLTDHGISDDTEYSKLNLNSNPEQAEVILNNLLMALAANKLDIISHEFFNLKMTLSPRDLALNVCAPLLRKVGQYVYEAKLTIAQEHVISSIIKFHLGKFIYRSFEEKRNPEQTIMLTTPEGEYHEFGIMLASLLCVHYKKPFFYLGPNMPADALVDAIKSIGSSEILVGTTMFTFDGNVNQLTNYFETIINNIGGDKKIIAGGDGVYDTERLQNKSNFTYIPSLDHLDLYLSKKLPS